MDINFKQAGVINASTICFALVFICLRCEEEFA
jgi:hypothetical protein